MDNVVPLDNKQLRIYNNTNFTRVSVDEAIAQGLNTWKDWKCSAGTRGLYIDFDGNIWVGNCASSHFNSGVHANKTITAWAKKRLEIFGEYPHADWYNANTVTGWPLPKKDWETCEQHIKLQTQLKVEEQKFFANLGKSIQAINTNDSAWKWESTLKDIKNVWGLLGNIREGFDVPDDWVTCPYGNCGCGADVILSKSKTHEHRDILDVTNNGVSGTMRVDNYTNTIADQVGVEMNFPIEFQVMWDLGRRCNYNCT